MPPPGFGKGNAHTKPGADEKYIELKRKTARMHAARALSIDSEKEKSILDIISNSPLDRERKVEALKATRDWLSLARKGIDPRIPNSGAKKCGHPKCSSHKEHQHHFLCQTRPRKPTQPELGVKAAVEAAVGIFLADCKEQLAALEVRAKSLLERTRGSASLLSHDQAF